MNFLTRPFYAAVLTALVCVAMPVRAQEPQIRLHEQFVPPAPLPLEDTQTVAEAESLDPSDGGELGRQQILIRQLGARPLRVYSETDSLYNSNILLVENDRTSDGLLHQTFGVSYSPRLLDKLTATVFAKYQMVRYTDNDVLDFDANDVGISLSRPVENWFTVYGGFQASRLYLDDGGREFFRMYDTTIGLWHGRTIEDWGWLFFGYQLDWRPSTPSEFTRVDNAAYVGLKFIPSDKFTVQLLYRIRAEEYLQVSRTDLNHLVSLVASYEFNDYVSLRAFAEYGANNSSADGFDYDVLTGGGGLKLQVRF